MLDSYLSALCQYAVRTGLPRLRRRRLPSFCRL